MDSLSPKLPEADPAPSDDADARDLEERAKTLLHIGQTCAQVARQLGLTIATANRIGRSIRRVNNKTARVEWDGEILSADDAARDHDLRDASRLTNDTLHGNGERKRRSEQAARVDAILSASGRTFLKSTPVSDIAEITQDATPKKKWCADFALPRRKKT